MMEKSESSQVVYDKNVIDFLAVAAELCHFLEGEAELPRSEWVERALKLLPLLYLKALLLPETKGMHDELPPTFVREEDYARVASRVAAVMGEEDTYLDVFVEDMKYSDRPISAFVSENVADLYQDIRNFVSVYQFELSEQMGIALSACRENFFLYWGQKLVNVLRPLHTLKCREEENGMDDNLGKINNEELWD
jgi:hypothetical protein